MAAKSKAELESDFDRLYELPLTEFTAARDELAKRLRSEGRREQADEVKKLRKPTAAVWLVNRLARERQPDVQRLLKAGESLAKSQPQAAAGESSQAFAQARREEQRALQPLAKAAREIGGREGIGASVVGRATETLRAASLRPEGRELLRRGRLTEELEPPGFDVLIGGEAPAPRRARKQEQRPRADARAERRRLLKQARERVQQLRAEERELAAAARAAEREAERAETQAAAARARADDAAEEARVAAGRVAAAQTEDAALR
jgi:hypothetical protein